MALTPRHTENHLETVEQQHAGEEILGIDLPEIDPETQRERRVSRNLGQPERPSVQKLVEGKSNIVQKLRVNRSFKNPVAPSGHIRVEPKATTSLSSQPHENINKKSVINTPTQPVIRKRVTAPYVSRYGRKVFPTERLIESWR